MGQRFLRRRARTVVWPAAACGTGGVGPGRGSVPSYEQVIVGRGATGIGMHADAYGLGEARRLVSTCLTICRGCKRVLLRVATLVVSLATLF